MVDEHMRLENAYDFPGCVGVFGRPQYQLIADGELYDGADRVRYFLSQNHTAFPDFVFEPTRVSPTTDAVLVEGRFVGTQLGPWRGLPASGRKVDFQMCLIFEFDGESLVNEKVYFDLNTPLLQRLYDTPEKQAARPWAQYLNWVTIVAIYIGAFFAVFYKQILFASVPTAAVHPYVASHWVVGVAVAVNFGLLLFEWVTIRQYSDSLLAAAGVHEKVTAAHY